MHEEVRRYYGETLKSSTDLKTTACCTPAAPGGIASNALQHIHPVVRDRYFGCGLVLPEALEGLSVLDLGCGAGRDCYLLAQLVGERGRVVGIDMTAEQLAVAREYLDYHRDRFGYARTNVEFVEGNIERLSEIDLPAGGFDLIVSNCVINLAEDKAAVFDAAWRLLRTGGELFFADIYSDRRIPAKLRADPVLYGECLSGALYWNDFLHLARASGFADPRVLDSRPVEISDVALAAKLGDVRFAAATCRLFKLTELELSRENYGQAVTYLGTLPGQPDRFRFDADNEFEAGEYRAVCANTFRILTQSRLHEHFEGRDNSVHRGPFPVTPPVLPFAPVPRSAEGGCC